MFGLSGLASMLVGAAVIALVSATSAGFAVHHWDQVAYLKLEKKQSDEDNAALKEEVKLQAARDRVSHDVDVANAQAQQKIQVITRNIIQKVPVYVTEKQNAACVLPNSVIKLLDAAGTQTDPDTLPGASSEPNDSPSGIPLSEAVSLLVNNLGDSAANRQQLKSLIDWTTKQKAAAP